MTTSADLSLWISDQKESMVSDLIEFISQETPSDNLDLLHSGLEWAENWLDKRLGEPAARRRTPGGEYGDTVVLEYPPVGNCTSWISALCHYDTVWDSGTLEGWTPTIDGDRLTGPGVFDMKAGFVQFVWALSACNQAGIDRPGIRLVLNGDEEIGSPSSRTTIEQEVSKGGPVLVFEASSNGAVKTARKGVGIFRVDVVGQEAHAGLNPESGVSAIDEISRLVLALHSAADLDRGTSVNVGVLNAGTRTNVTAGRATARVDVRVTSADEAARIDSLLTMLKPHNPLARVTVEGGWNRPVMLRTERSAELFHLAAEVANELGFELQETSVGGYSDGNFAAALGLPVLDGLGAVGGGAHARSEWISVDGMLQRAALTAGLISRLSTGFPATREP